MKYILLSLCFLGMFGCAYVDDAKSTAFHETKASTLLKRYNWFKDAAAQLDAFQADIKVYEARLTNLKKDYDNQPRIKWAREDREQANVWEQELAGTKGAYNSLCAEYNSNMAKEQWKFCNIGDLPKGADRPLPREFKLYETK
jgi:hypothetical protein